MTTCTYNANGNLVVENEADSLTTLTWGYEDELLTVLRPTNALFTMTYDGDLKRRRRAQGANWVDYVWDREQVLLEADKNGATTARYALGRMVYGDLVSQYRSAAASYYHYDALGSTRELTDADGTVTDTYVYRAFGSLRASTGSTTNRFRYIGKLGYYHEAALAGYYLRRRYYTPEVRRFVSRDPALEDGVSGYVYVGNRVGRATDPSGYVDPRCDLDPLHPICDPRPRLCEPPDDRLPPKVTIPRLPPPWRPWPPGLPPPVRRRPGVPPGGGPPYQPPPGTRPGHGPNEPVLPPDGPPVHVLPVRHYPPDLLEGCQKLYDMWTDAQNGKPPDHDLLVLAAQDCCEEWIKEMLGGEYEKCLDKLVKAVEDAYRDARRRQQVR